MFAYVLLRFWHFWQFKFHMVVQRRS